MQKLPHSYKVLVKGNPTDNLEVTGDGLPQLRTAAPAGFDGPGDQWSPEDLLMASVSSCLVLSFRAIAKASSLQWQSIECETSGELNQVERRIRFTRISSRIRLRIDSADKEETAAKLLKKAEETCFISNSLASPCELEFDIEVG